MGKIVLNWVPHSVSQKKKKGGRSRVKWTVYGVCAQPLCTDTWQRGLHALLCSSVRTDAWLRAESFHKALQMRFLTTSSPLSFSAGAQAPPVLDLIWHLSLWRKALGAPGWALVWGAERSEGSRPSLALSLFTSHLIDRLDPFCSDLKTK